MKFCVLKMQKLENAITADVRMDLREIISQQNCRCHRIIVNEKTADCKQISQRKSEFSWIARSSTLRMESERLTGCSFMYVDSIQKRFMNSKKLKIHFLAHTK